MTPETSRVEKMRALMNNKGVDALLVTRREDVRYLTGFTGSAGSVLLDAAQTCLITDFRYELQAGREAKNAILLVQKKDFFSTFREAADQRGIQTVWFDESSLTVEFLTKLKQTGIRARKYRNLVQQLRMQKDRTELARMRKAIARAEEAFRKLTPFIRKGVTEKTLGMRLEFLMREQGSRRAAFDTIVASGPNAAMPHASTTNRRLRKGDLVTFDFGAEADGYYCDMTRTYCLGRPTARQREIHAVVLAAQAEAIKRIRPGEACRNVDGAAREYIQRAGQGKHFGHGTGHGIGLMVHEGPSVSHLSRDVMERDMVFTVEPGIYIPGWGGVRIEDMLLVTDAGSKTMTGLPREIDGLKYL